MTKMKEVSSNQPRRDVSCITPVQLHFFESNNMFLNGDEGVVKRTQYAEVVCVSNDLVSFSKEEMESQSTLIHIKEKLLRILPYEIAQKMIELLQFVFTLRATKCGEGRDYTIYGCHYDPKVMLGENARSVWIVVIDSATQDDLSDATEWKMRKETFAFRFTIFSMNYGDFDARDEIK